MTDPAFAGQIVVQAFPLIGNYGMISADAESVKAQVAGYVVRDLCDMPSNFRMETTLEEYLKEQEIMGITDIDTRELTKIIREEGVMKAKILLEEPKNASFDFEIADAVKDVSCIEAISLETNDAEKTVGILDLGMLKSMATTLASKGVKVDILPYNTKAEELLKYDGILLSYIQPSGYGVYNMESKFDSPENEWIQGATLLNIKPDGTYTAERIYNHK